MFCADYVIAFVYHAIITLGTVYMFSSPSNEQSHDCANSEKKDSKEGSRQMARKFAAAALGLDYRPPATGTKCTEERTVENREKYIHNLPLCTHGLTPVGVGLLSGLGASASLYPFDFVRSGVLQPGLRRILSAGSTVPYAGTLFGVYFACRDPTSGSSQMKWAILASSCAVLAEAPLDHAKRAMMGSTKVMVGANLLFVPFASMMLFMYDKAAIKLVTPHIN